MAIMAILTKMSIDDKFEFGKYSGLSVRDLLKQKKGLYLMWCLENLNGFHLEPLNFENSIRNTYFRQYLAVLKNKKRNGI